MYTRSKFPMIGNQETTLQACDMHDHSIFDADVCEDDKRSVHKVAWLGRIGPEIDHDVEKKARIILQ